MGFEPTRAEYIGLAVQRLNHSATSSHALNKKYFMICILSIRTDFFLLLQGYYSSKISSNNLCGDLPIEVKTCMSNGSDRSMDQSSFIQIFFLLPFALFGTFRTFSCSIIYFICLSFSQNDFQLSVTKIKVITLANYKEHRQCSEPIKTRRI